MERAPLQDPGWRLAVPGYSEVTCFCGEFTQEISMSVTGKVKNGVVVLPLGTKLPEGAEVRVETLKSSEEDDPLVAAVERLAKPRPHLPKDYALNHGRYIVANRKNEESLRG